MKTTTFVLWVVDCESEKVVESSESAKHVRIELHLRKCNYTTSRSLSADVLMLCNYTFEGVINFKGLWVQIFWRLLTLQNYITPQLHLNYALTERLL